MRPGVFLGINFTEMRNQLWAQMKTQKQRRLKVSVPTNDGVKIFPGMLGRAKFFFVYEIENGGDIRLVEKRINPFENTMQPLKTLDVYELIDDCSIIIAARIGKKGATRLRERGLNLIFKVGNIHETVVSILNDL